LKRTLRFAILLSLVCTALAVFSNFAQAQKVDVAFGVSTLEAPSANSTGPSLTGGTYPGFSGDVLFWHNFGIGGEIFWRATQSIYPSIPPIPYRPLFLDFDGVYAPKLASHAWLELTAGIGAVAAKIAKIDRALEKHASPLVCLHRSRSALASPIPGSNCPRFTTAQ